MDDWIALGPLVMGIVGRIECERIERRSRCGRAVESPGLCWALGGRGFGSEQVLRLAANENDEGLTPGCAGGFH